MTRCLLLAYVVPVAVTGLLVGGTCSFLYVLAKG